MGSTKRLGRAKLLANFFLGQRKTYTPTLATELLGQSQSVGSVGLIGDHEIDLHRRIGFESRFLLRLGCRAFVEKLQQDGIPDTKPYGRQIGRSVAQIRKQAVVAAPAGDSPQAGS